MKILVVANMFPSKKFPMYGTFIKNFCDQLEEISIHYDKVVMHKQTNMLVKIISYAFFYFRSFFWALLGNYDIVYVHYPSYSALAILTAIKIKKRSLFVNVHGSDVFPTNENQKKFEPNTRKAINQADKVIVPSEYFKKVIIDKYQYPERQIHVYPSGGVDFKVFYPFNAEKIRSLRKYVGLNPDMITVGYVSRLYRLKGWETFVNAVEKLPKYYDRVQFLMVGSGPDEENLNRMLTKKQLTNVIHRFPAQSQRHLADYYNMLDIFVFAVAAAESLGLTAIEAMACGVPVFASDYAAPKYYVENGLNGYKFPLGDFVKLSELIEMYINFSNEERLKLKSGATNIASRYDSKAAKNTLRNIIE